MCCVNVKNRFIEFARFTYLQDNIHQRGFNRNIENCDTGSKAYAKHAKEYGVKIGRQGANWTTNQHEASLPQTDGRRKRRPRWRRQRRAGRSRTED